MLEHALLNLIDFVLWTDGLFQKKIQKAIPDLEDLLTLPREQLSRREIAIGPNKRYGTSCFMGLFLSCLAWFMICLGIADMGGQIAGATRIALFVTLLGIPVLAVFLSLQIFRGGYCILTQAGVELRHRRKVVFCPWALFDTTAQPRVRNGAQAVIPIQFAAIPPIEVWRRKDVPEHAVLRQPGHAVIARGYDVRSKQLRFAKSKHEVILADLYEIRLSDLAELILCLGRSLGSSKISTA